MQVSNISVAYADAGDNFTDTIAKARLLNADYMVFNYRLVRITPGSLLPGSMTIKTYINNREPGWEHA